METTTKNDVGTVFECIIKEGAAIVDISTATTLEIEFKSPGGVSTVKTAALVNTGSDGKLAYTRLAADFTRVGDWYYRGIATFSATEKYYSIDWTPFEIID